VSINAGLKRPSDIDISFGLAEKAEMKLGWKAKVHLPEIVSRMVEVEMQK
jgi:GDP-D-mannose dehydratase